jgi:GTPase involved in cell partitioning and DNA repair
LQSATAELEKVRDLSSKLPTSGKSALATLITAARPSIEDMFRKVLAIPGIEALVKPTVDQLRATLDDLAKA